MGRGGMACPKPSRGTSLIESRERRKAVVAFEEGEKDRVRARDKRCRWPQCENCKRYQPRLEVAHVRAKGQGGDHGTRSSADQMILLDFLTHQGDDGLERHQREIVPLTEKGTRGPCEFWATGEDGQLYLVAVEYAPFCYVRD